MKGSSCPNLPPPNPLLLVSTYYFKIMICKLFSPELSTNIFCRTLVTLNHQIPVKCRSITTWGRFGMKQSFKMYTKLFLHHSCKGIDAALKKLGWSTPVHPFHYSCFVFNHLEMVTLQQTLTAKYVYQNTINTVYSFRKKRQCRQCNAGNAMRQCSFSDDQGIYAIPNPTPTPTNSITETQNRPSWGT